MFHIKHVDLQVKESSSTFFRLKSIEILSNFLRSVIALTPDDLLQCIYLCLNRIAPAYEGMELGIGETVLMKAIAEATGRIVNGFHDKFQYYFKFV
jgi:DNA ligase N terminus